MEVREVQPSKHPVKLVTEEGISTEVREVHLLKQRSPKLVTEEGISMEVREVQFWKQ